MILITDDAPLRLSGEPAGGGRLFPMFRPTWHFLLVTLAGFINRRQQDEIAYLQEENRVLREKLGNKRILLNVAQKRRLATAVAKLGMKVLQGCATLFSPETLLRWACARRVRGALPPGTAAPGPGQPADHPAGA